MSRRAVGVAVVVVLGVLFLMAAANDMAVQIDTGLIP